MIIYDASQKLKNSLETIELDAYIKGVFDAAEFKEEDHPRGGEGSGKGGQFVKSEKTKQKEDEVDKLNDPLSGKYPNWDSSEGVALRNRLSEHPFKDAISKALGESHNSLPSFYIKLFATHVGKEEELDDDITIGKERFDEEYRKAHNQMKQAERGKDWEKYEKATRRAKKAAENFISSLLKKYPLPSKK